LTLDIWSACEKQLEPAKLDGKIIRIVESQEQIATNNIVDDLHEQAILESLLDKTKPPVPASAQHLHYLLYTPFRYPPLKYGSRFGSRFEPSLFYGSRTITTALAETAYYRLLFWTGMREPPEQLTTQHTAFTTAIHTTQGIQLQSPPFSKYQKNLTSKSSYLETQMLGRAMRKNGIDAFEYISTRNNTGNSLNVALLTPDAISSTAPISTTTLICTTNEESIAFIDDTKNVYQYAAALFMENGQFPIPGS